jgi:putative DNA primase/helicase
VPAIVRDATAVYLADEDVFGRWLEESCVLEKHFFSAVNVLFRNWQLWCERNGERAGSQKRFSQNLESRGYTRERTAEARGFKGLTLKVDPISKHGNSTLRPDTCDRLPVLTRMHARARNGDMT